MTFYVIYKHTKSGVPSHYALFTFERMQDAIAKAQTMRNVSVYQRCNGNEVEILY